MIHMELIGVYRVLKNWKMTLPKEVREFFSLKEGDKLVIYLDKENRCMVVVKWEKGMRLERQSKEK